MDNQNTRLKGKKLRAQRVLILVLMDNQNTIQKINPNEAKYCLNPCSNG